MNQLWLFEGDSQLTIPATEEEIQQSMAEVRQMVERQATPAKSPKTLRKLRSKSTVDVPSTTPSPSTTKTPRPTAAKSKPKPKAKAAVAKAMVRKVLKQKAKGKLGKSQASGHSSGEACNASKKRKRVQDPDAKKMAKGDKNTLKTKEEPKSPAATGKAIKECLARADTRDMKAAPATRKSKPAEPIDEPEDDSNCDSDAELEEQLRRKRDQHARYMRFSRSLKSHLIENITNKSCKLYKFQKALLVIIIYLVLMH